MQPSYLVLEIQKLLKQALLKLDLEVDELNITRNGDLNFGDYNSSIAMNLGKKLGINPKELARLIVAKIKGGFLEKVEVAGPGFINFYLKPEFVKDMVGMLDTSDFYSQLAKQGKGKTMVIDYSAPNIAKPFGIGHLRSTVIGQAIYNLYKLLGWKTIGDNHIGDWGTQFGKLIVAIKKFNNKPLEELSIEELEKLYVQYHAEAEKNPELDEEARDWFSRLEKGDTEARKMWKECVEVSLKEHEKVYKLLNIKIDHTHGESFYTDLMPNVLEKCDQMGVAKLSQGAKIIEFENMPAAMLVKSNGTTTYFTRDLATIMYRMDTFKPDLIVYEVGADQSLHFRQLFAAAVKLGLVPKTQLIHVAHGLYRWKDGKFSTRKGDTIHLKDVSNKALEVAKEIATKAKIQKHDQSGDQEITTGIAVGAIKFNDLLSDPKKDIIFDWDKVMSLEGDSGPYLQYTYARIQSLLAKSPIGQVENVNISLFSNQEISLLKLLLALEDKLLESADRFSPSVLCTYALQIAHGFNEFYGTTKILGQKEEAERLFLAKKSQDVLKILLQILGIKTILVI